MGTYHLGTVGGDSGDGTNCPVLSQHFPTKDNWDDTAHRTAGDDTADRAVGTVPTVPAVPI
jgi:hypothetical protein